jgi:hypothetical protein
MFTAVGKEYNLTGSVRILVNVKRLKVAADLGIFVDGFE